MNAEKQHPDRFASTPEGELRSKRDSPGGLARGESQTPSSLENSPSPVKGWQSETDGVDATDKSMNNDEQHPDHFAPLKTTAGLENSPSPVKGWTRSGRGSFNGNTTP